MRRLLLCPPDYYGIEYEINPWMRRTQNAQPDLARAQWNSLHAALQSLGCQVELLEPQPGLPDLVFTANAGLVIGRRFIPSSFRLSLRTLLDYLTDALSWRIRAGVGGPGTVPAQGMDTGLPTSPKKRAVDS